MRTTLKPQLSLMAMVALAAGCAHYPVNPPTDSAAAPSYGFETLAKDADNTDAFMLCLSFSGGGTRAAALAYGVMQALRAQQITVDGETKRLIDEVDCISSVSGGSFTAAYYGLFGERLFTDFRDVFLDRNIQGALAKQLLNPINLFSVLSPNYGRTDLAAHFYGREIFDEKRFTTLRDNGRPFLIINATNLEPGRQFSFTGTQFDAIGSDLLAYPVSRAVAASSAFPFLLSAITLENHPLPEDYAPPGWYRGALNADDRWRRRYRAAEGLDYYLKDSAGGDKQHPYIHLMDGGLSDNIGARALLDAYAHGFIRNCINGTPDCEGVERLVFIVVNARTESSDDLSTENSPPGLITVAEKTASISLDNYSFDSVALLRERLSERAKTQRSLRACNDRLQQSCPDASFFPTFANIVDPYVIEIAFEGVSELDCDAPECKSADYYLGLPTSFKLTQEQVDNLVAIGPRLLQASPQFGCLIDVLEAAAESRSRPDECYIGAGVEGPG